MTLCLPFADYCPLLSFCLQLCVFPTLLEPLRLFSNLSSTAQNETLCSSQHLPTSFSLSFSPAPSSLTLSCLLCHPRVHSVLPTDDWPCHWGVTTVDSHLYSSFSFTVETSLSCDSTEQTLGNNKMAGGDFNFLSPSNDQTIWYQKQIVVFMQTFVSLLCPSKSFISLLFIFLSVIFNYLKENLEQLEHPLKILFNCSPCSSDIIVTSVQSGTLWHVWVRLQVQQSSQPNPTIQRLDKKCIRLIFLY